jgi:hypothetical protein
VGVKEDAKQNLLLGLEQAPASFLSELPEQILGQVLEPELEQAAAQRAGVLWLEDAEEWTALLEETVHGRTQGVGRYRIEFLGVVRYATERDAARQARDLRPIDSRDHREDPAISEGIIMTRAAGSFAGARRRLLLRVVVDGLSVFLVSCFSGHGGKGGGKGGAGGDDGGVTPGGTVTIIAPSVSFPQVVAGATLDFEAKVKNGNGNGVSWGVQSGDSCTGTNGISSLGVPGGGGGVGTIPANTPNNTVVTYTAPSALPLDAPFIFVTVTALQSPETTGPCVVVVVVATKNALFASNFVFRLRGFASSGLPFGIIGRFNADGKGNISSGLEDVDIAQTDGSSVGFTKVAFTGSYNMDTSRHGTMTLIVAASAPWKARPPVTPPPATMTFSFTLSLDGSFGSLIETDGAATPVEYVGSGDFQVQGNSSKFTTTNIVGSYLVSLTGTAGVNASAVNKGLIGRLNLAASTGLTGTILNTSRADDESGAPTQTLTGTYSIDDQPSGHGTLNVTGGANPIISFYIGAPRRFYALRTDNNPAGTSPDAILMGVVRFLPSTATFDNTSMGAVLFEMLGINGGHASAVVGTFVSGQKIGSNTDGFLQGILDLNDGGKVPGSPPISFAGPNGPNIASFTVAPMGRGTMSISLGGVTYNFIFYLRAQAVGFLLEHPASDNSSRGRSGSFFPQSVTSVGGGSFMGSTEVATAGSENGLTLLPLTVSGSSASFQNGTRYVSALGSAATSGPASGAFALTDTANNRGTLTMTSSGGIAGSGTAAFYLVSDSEMIAIGTDPTNMEPQIIAFDE